MILDSKWPRLQQRRQQAKATKSYPGAVKEVDVTTTLAQQKRDWEVYFQHSDRTSIYIGLFPDIVRSWKSDSVLRCHVKKLIKLRWHTPHMKHESEYVHMYIHTYICTYIRIHVHIYCILFDNLNK